MSPRVYTRKFDHDEARARYAAGETQDALAREFGVSPGAIWFAIHPDAAARRNDRSRAWLMSGVCIDCGVPGVTREGHGGRGKGRCKPCAAKARALVTDTHAHCSTCKEWKPRNEFARSRKRPARGVHGECRSCQTARRRAYREARKVPCVDCGAPTHSTAPGTGRRTKVARCQSCANRAHRKADAQGVEAAQANKEME